MWLIVRSFAGRSAIWVRDAFAWAFFALTCIAAMVICLDILLHQTTAKEPSGTVISAAGGLLLVAAFLVRHGEAITLRLKKLGPLELFEEVREALASLEDLASKVPDPKVSNDEVLLKPAQLSPQEKFAFRQGDLVAAMLSLGGTEPTQGVSRRHYYELLFKVGSCALSQKEWPRATARLERLEEISKGTYKQRDVLFLSGAAYFHWGQGTESDKPEQQQYFEKARRQLTKLIDLGNVNQPAAYFFLAYAQDELQQWHEAVANNREMLRRRPRCAPAKYNCAISLIKLQRLSDAYKMLGQLSSEDQDLDLVLAVYKNDPDLLPWVQDATLRRRILLKLGDLEGQWKAART